MEGQVPEVESVSGTEVELPALPQAMAEPAKQWQSK